MKAIKAGGERNPRTGGMNLFILKSTIGDVALSTIYRGIIPFAIADVLRINIVILFPVIPLLCPRLAG